MSNPLKHMILKPLVQYGLWVLAMLAFGTLLPESINKPSQDFNFYKISVIFVVLVFVVVNQKRMQKILAHMTSSKDNFNEEIEATKLFKTIPILLLANFFNCYYLGNNLFFLLIFFNIVIAIIGYALTKKIKRYEFLEDIKHKSWDFEVENVSEIIDIIKSMNKEEFERFSNYSYVLAKALESKQKEALIKLLKDMYKTSESRDYKFKAKYLAVALDIFLFDSVEEFIKEGFTLEDLDCGLSYAVMVSHLYSMKEEIGSIGVKRIMENLEDQSKFREFKLELSKSSKDSPKRKLLELELIASAVQNEKAKRKINKI